MTLEQVQVLLLTSIITGVIVKILDYLYDKNNERRGRLDKKIDEVINHLNEYGELAVFYKNTSSLQISSPLDENGQPLTDESGEEIVNVIAFEPEPKYNEAIKTMKGSELSSVINLKRVAIDLQSSKIHDILMEIDKSGKLDEQLSDLYNKNMIDVNNILNNPNFPSPGVSFQWMQSKLREVDELRQKIRKDLEKYRR
jgi:hypothetical protein